MLQSRSRSQNCLNVLIETYWNVNTISSRISGKSLKVLIETYWNVNNAVIASVNISETRINRNILECKFC